MTLIGGALEPRISVLVSACGWSPLKGLQGAVVENMIQPYNFPRLKHYVEEQNTIPYDFNHIASLIAPRPFLDIRADADQFFPNVADTREAETELTRLYALHGVPDRYRSVWFDGKHGYTATAARETQAWLYRYLFV